MMVMPLILPANNSIQEIQRTFRDLQAYISTLNTGSAAPTTTSAQLNLNTTGKGGPTWGSGTQQTGLSSSIPKMDSLAGAVGTSTLVSRDDHSHPSDTTKASLSGASFTGPVSVPNFTVTGIQTNTNTTDLSGAHTGALQIAGGVWIGKQLQVDGNFTVGGTFYANNGVVVSGSAATGALGTYPAWSTVFEEGGWLSHHSDIVAIGNASMFGTLDLMLGNTNFENLGANGMIGLTVWMDGIHSAAPAVNIPGYLTVGYNGIFAGYLTAGNTFSGTSAALSTSVAGALVVGTGGTSTGLIAGNMASGTGNLLSLDYAGVNRFHIDYLGNLWVGGTPTFAAGAIFTGNASTSAYSSGLYPQLATIIEEAGFTPSLGHSDIVAIGSNAGGPGNTGIGPNGYGNYGVLDLIVADTNFNGAAGVGPYSNGIIGLTVMQDGIHANYATVKIPGYLTVGKTMTLTGALVANGGVTYTGGLGGDTLTLSGAATATSFNSLTGVASVAPLAVAATAVLGSSTLAARQDHVHAFPVLSGAITTTGSSLVTTLYATQSAAVTWTAQQTFSGTSTPVLLSAALTGNGLQVGSGIVTNALICANKTSGGGNLLALDYAGVNVFHIDYLGNLYLLGTPTFANGLIVTGSAATSAYSSGLYPASSTIFEESGFSPALGHSDIVAIGSNTGGPGHTGIGPNGYGLYGTLDLCVADTNFNGNAGTGPYSNGLIGLRVWQDGIHSNYACVNMMGYMNVAQTATFNGPVVFNSTVSGFGWGSIGGTLSSQTDLMTKFGNYALLSGAAFTGRVTTTQTTGIDYFLLTRSGVTNWGISVTNNGTSDALGLVPASGGAITNFPIGGGFNTNGAITSTGITSYGVIEADRAIGNDLLHFKESGTTKWVIYAPTTNKLAWWNGTCGNMLVMDGTAGSASFSGAPVSMGALSATTGTFSGAVSAAAGVSFSASSGWVAGSIYYGSGNGVVIGGKAGTTNDFLLTNSGSYPVMAVPTGTQNVVFSGPLTGTTATLSGAISATSGTFSSTVNAPLFNIPIVPASGNSMFQVIAQGGGDSLDFGITGSSYVNAGCTWQNGGKNIIYVPNGGALLIGNANSSTSYITLNGSNITSGSATISAASRRVSITGGSISMQADTGGWAEGLWFTNNALSTVLAGFGVLGSGDTINFHYIGASYSSPLLKVDPSGNGTFAASANAPYITVSSTTSAYGMLKVNNTGTGEASMSFSNNNSGPGAAGASPGGNVWGLGLGVNGISSNFGLWNGALSTNAFTVAQATSNVWFAGQVQIAANMGLHVPDGAPGTVDHCFYALSGNPWWSGTEIYTTSNINNSFQTLQSLIALNGAPIPCTSAQKAAGSTVLGVTITPAGVGLGNSIYVVDDTTYDGTQGTVYTVVAGPAWSAAKPGHMAVGCLSAMSIGATSLAVQVALAGQYISSTNFTSGLDAYGNDTTGHASAWGVPKAVSSTYYGQPAGFAIYGTTGVKTLCYNGDPTNASGVWTRPTVQAEFGAGLSIAGYDVGALSLGRLVNGGSAMYPAGSGGIWVCPPGITNVEVLVCGAGGGGSGITAGRGFGGGGACCSAVVQVNPGTSYSYTVGSGGAGGNAGATGGTGGTSTFSGPAAGSAPAINITCYGGGGGTGNVTGGNSGYVTMNGTTLVAQVAGTASNGTNSNNLNGAIFDFACSGASAGTSTTAGSCPGFPTSTGAAPSGFGLGGTNFAACTGYGGGGGASVASGGIGYAGGPGCVRLRW